MPLVPLARVIRAHGIRGELRLKLYNPDSATLAAGQDVELYRNGETLLRGEITQMRPVQGAVLIRLHGVDDRNRAEALRGAEIGVEAATLPPLDPDEYYTHQLEGCTVIDVRGQVRGRVQRLSDNGAHDLLHVVDAGREWLLPLVEAWVQEMDFEAGEIHVGDVDDLVELGLGGG